MYIVIIFPKVTLSNTIFGGIDAEVERFDRHTTAVHRGRHCDIGWMLTAVQPHAEEETLHRGKRTVA